MKKPLPDHRIERRPLAKLVPYAKNARTHSPEQDAQIAASIREWGWTFPILVDEKDGIIAGHGRALAAKELGVKDVPVIVAKGWTPEQKRAYVLADNKLAENAGWDRDLLKVEIGELGAAGFDLGLAGFSGADLASIAAWGNVWHTDPDDVPEPRAIPAAQAGDVWQLGQHRLVCGDATDEAAVRACLRHEKPHLLVSDPPYGVDYDPAWRKRFGSAGVATGKVTNDDRADWREAWALFQGDVAYVWHGALHNVLVAESLAAAGLKVRSQIVWVKTRAPISRGDYHWQHEPAFYAEREGEEAEPEGWSIDHGSASYVVRPGKNARWTGGRKQTTVWFIENIKNETGHGTQKPVECMRRPIVNNSQAGDAVYDPFLGSGTTLIAAEMEGRRCLSIEIDPVYVDVAIRRWESFTGNKATKQASGEGVEKVAA